jgi:hypothetical protein
MDSDPLVPVRRHGSIRPAMVLATSALVIALLLGVPARAATPPVLVNYQGVLRDQNDQPLSGNYDLLLRFMDAATAGNEILIDQHAAVTGNAVVVSGGLFNVALGSGTITDGSGPGAYTSLDAVFRDYGSVWLEVRVGAETLSPRTPIQSAPYALNAASAVNATLLNGQPAGSFLDTSATQQDKNGRLNVYNGNSFEPAIQGQNLASLGIGVYGQGDYVGLEGAGNTSGGDFFGAYGLRAYGSGGSGSAAGLFQGSGISNGITAMAANGEAGRFTSTNSYAPSADLAYSNVGVAGACSSYGGIGVSGYAERLGVSGHALGIFAGGAKGGQFIADGAFSVGVDASGVTGGQFSSTSSPGLSVKLADSNRGVNASGGDYAGYFQTASAGSSGLYASGASTGINANGGDYGGYFQSVNSGSVALFASGGTGISATGQTRGGAFADAGVDRATLASGGLGISASGSAAGGYLSNGSPWFSYTYIPYQGDGVYAYGSSAGAELRNFSTASYAYVGWSTYKIGGNGSVAFIQNHPADPSKVIVYTAPEGDETAVYTRGSGRLVDGEARVALGETFSLVTNPDIGLTASITPRGEPIALAVSEVSPSELVVRGPGGSGAEFDYMVWGLRIGFEEQSVVQPKRDESKIPSMHQHEQFFKDDPSLRRYTALARFKDVEQTVRGRKQVDLSRADQLRQAVGTFPFAETEAGAIDRTHAPGRPAGEPRPSLTAGAGVAPGAVEPDAAEAARATRPDWPGAGLPAGVDLFAVDEAIEAGDLVSLMPASAGSVVRSAGPDDSLVIGCAQSSEAGSPGQVAVATSHIALCRVDAAYGAVAAGDRITASPVRGVAMKADPGTAGGTVIGRAIDPLPAGAGLVRVVLGAR